MDKRSIRLWEAIPETPEMCREAVLDAVRTYREEKTMWRPSKVILVAALILALLCGTAYAVASYYSVRDYFADKRTPLETESYIVPLETGQDSTGLRFFLGDAVFDGRDLVFTMNVKAEEGTQALYVFPRLQAFCGGQELPVNYRGSGMLGYSGSFVPHPDYPLDGVGDQGVEASLEEIVAGEVTWRYTLELYRPLGEVVIPRDYDPETESMEAWNEYLRSLAREGKIGCLYGADIFDWLHAVSGSDDDDTFTQRMIATGLFELADTVVFEFTTAAPQKTPLPSAQTFVFDDFTLTVVSVEQTFLQVDYKLEVVFNEKQGHEHDVRQWYDLYDQNDTLLMRRWAMLELAEDKLHCTVEGVVERISDEPLTSLTFVEKLSSWEEPRERRTFTVDLTK